MSESKLSNHTIVWLEEHPMPRLVYSLSGIFSAGWVAEATSDFLLTRDRLPEPWDIPDHIGNFTESGMAVGVIGALGTALALGTARSNEAMEKRLTPRTANVVALGTFASTCAIQYYGEKYGLGSAGGTANTGDMTDAAYGMTWAGVSSLWLRHSLKKFIHRTKSDNSHTFEQPDQSTELND